MILKSNLDYMWNKVVTPRLGVAPYTFGGSFVASNSTIGTDCSGAVSAELGALLYGPAMPWPRQFWTGTFAGARPGQTGPFDNVQETAPLVCIARYSDAPADAAMIIAVKQDPDPSNAHMICQVGGVTIEMGGDGGTYHTNLTDPTCSRIDDTSEFNQWFYLPGPIVSTARGVDYSGGRPGGAAIKAAGFSFACRYVFDGAPQLPEKLLTAAEASDLIANGVAVVSNWEAAADNARGGFSQGVSDAQGANANHLTAGGPTGAPIYFSVDYDAPESDQAAINAYFQGVASVIGLNRTGVYGGYWVVKRLFDAGLVTWGWQTEAWSGDPAGLAPAGPDGDYLDPRCQILQRNSEGFVNIGGVQCDINDAMTLNFGQWNPPTTPPSNGGFMALSDQQQGDLYTWVGDLHGAAFNPITSQSPFRAPGEGAIWTTKDLPHNDDGFLHPIYVEWAAKKGDQGSIAELEAVAAMNDPSRAADIALAQATLAELAAATPVVASPDAPVAPAPVTPAPDPVTPTRNPLKVAPMSYLHTITTLVGGASAVGAWVIAHDIFSTQVSGAISGGVLALTALFNFLVKEEGN